MLLRETTEASVTPPPDPVYRALEKIIEKRQERAAKMTAL